MFGVPTLRGRTPPALLCLPRRKMMLGLAGGALATTLRALSARAQTAAPAAGSPAQAQSGAPPEAQPSAGAAPAAAPVFICKSEII